MNQKEINYWFTNLNEFNKLSKFNNIIIKKPTIIKKTEKKIDNVSMILKNKCLSIL